VPGDQLLPRGCIENPFERRPRNLSVRAVLRSHRNLRVSTGEQTTENQRRELEAVARHRGWEIVAVYGDQGVSGAKGRDKRPQLDRMLRDAVRGKFDILAAWAVDRLGRSLQDLVATPGELRASGVDLVLLPD
jgi:DNA invertase Pin-like site-specific DNA recombinase